ncbi:hypothetical protein OH76DRAFT_1403288 [Lentinus brumalis]|uniref:DNA-directed DNA polymerase n=1 Tax=Lentinus brumalis TaxID=2498619 RepID=A0A371DB00_9APHY|nr:hypothetical protein OH76DRAFT_1403288 [Polyporus brumalis]
MLSDVELFFAEQEAIMNRPSESVADYLERRQRSRTSTSYTFNPETIAIGSLDNVISVLRGHRDARPASPPQPGSEGLNASHSSVVITAQPPASDASGENLPERYRRCFSTGAGLTLTHKHEGRLAELSLPATLAGIEDDARVRRGACKGPAGKLGLQTASASSSDVQRGGQKRLGGVRELTAGTGRRHDAPGDCSNITTPPSTAPDPVVPVSKGASGRGKAAARPREPAKRATAGRSSTAAKKTKGQKEKEPKYTLSEYAKMLQAQATAQPQQGGKRKVPQFLKGRRIYFYGGDFNFVGRSTRNKMQLIVKYGGELVPEYDPDRITHIVCGDSIAKGSLLSAIKVKQSSDIPDHIATVLWDWVVSGHGRRPVKRTSQQGERGEGSEGITCQATGTPTDEDEYEYPMDSEFLHAAFPERFYDGKEPWAKRARTKSESGQMKTGPASEAQTRDGGSTSNVAAEQSSDEFSHISDFTQDKISPGDGAKICPNAGLPSPPSSPSYPRSDPPQPLGRDVSALAPGAGAAVGNAAGPSKTTFVVGSCDDPLAEFYEQARAERDAEWYGKDESDDESVTSEGNGGRAAGSSKGGKGKGFVCDDKHARARRGACPNQDVIAKLARLSDIYTVKIGHTDNKWRVYALKNAITTLRKHPTRIRTMKEAEALPGIGKRTAQKVFIETGDLRRIAHELTEDFEVVEMLAVIYNVGPTIACRWYQNGVRTLEDVLARKGDIKVSRAQEIAVRYYDGDIRHDTGRRDVFDTVGTPALRIDPKLFVRVMGSFRRGKADCGDIDVLITRPTADGKTHRGVLRRLLAVLHRKGIITEDLSLPRDFEDLELCYRGLCRRDPQSRRRRIDFLTIPWKSRGGALLYYTGDDIFNRSMRLKANRMGYSLNQRGLHADVIRDPQDRRKKLSEGKLIASESEEEIFRILGVPWQEPHERIRN